MSISIEEFDKLSPIRRGKPKKAEEKVKLEYVNFEEVIEKFNLGNTDKFKPHALKNPERIKIREIISNVDKCKWVLPRFQRYFDWKEKGIYLANHTQN